MSATVEQNLFCNIRTLSPQQLAKVEVFVECRATR
jgi:hypothetical protein